MGGVSRSLATNISNDKCEDCEYVLKDNKVGQTFWMKSDEGT